MCKCKCCFNSVDTTKRLDSGSEKAGARLLKSAPNIRFKCVIAMVFVCKRVWLKYAKRWKSLKFTMCYHFFEIGGLSWWFYGGVWVILGS